MNEKPVPEGLSRKAWEVSPISATLTRQGLALTSQPLFPSPDGIPDISKPERLTHRVDAAERAYPHLPRRTQMSHIRT
jgi:hypothetical protein